MLRMKWDNADDTPVQFIARRALFRNTFPAHM